MNKSLTLLAISLSFCLALSATTTWAQSTAWNEQPAQAMSLLPVPEPSGYWNHVAGSSYRGAAAPQTGHVGQISQSTSHVAGAISGSTLSGYAGAVNGSAMWEAGGTACDGCCETGCDTCCPAPCCPWFGALGGLVMTRDNPNPIWISFDNTNVNSAILSTRQADADWRGGYEASFGRRFGIDRALEVTYWSLDAFDDAASARLSTDRLNTPLNLTAVTVGGAAAANFFDNAREHRIERRNEIHNVELNWIHAPLAVDPNEWLSVNWLLGVRFFRFDEGLLFGSVAGGSEFGSGGGVNEAYLDVDVVNTLIGFQMGADGVYRICDNWSIVGGARAGIYGNHIRHRTLLYRGDGVAGSLAVESNENDVSMLAELEASLNWQVTRSFRAYVGYRALAVAGVALSDEQLPFFLADNMGIADIDSNGELILHGGMAGGAISY